MCLEPRLPLPPLSVPSARLPIEDLQSAKATSPFLWNASSTRSVTYNVIMSQASELPARVLSCWLIHYATNLKCVSRQFGWISTTSSLTSVVSLEVMSDHRRLQVDVSFHHFALKICQLAEAFSRGGGPRGRERRAEAAMHVNVNKEPEISMCRGCVWHHATLRMKLHTDFQFPSI